MIRRVSRVPGRRSTPPSGTTGPRPATTVAYPSWEITLDGMYPEWGPARHHPENHPERTSGSDAVQAALDLRDNGGQRPDDN